MEDLYQTSIRTHSDTVVSHYTIYSEKDRHYHVHIWDDYYEKTYTGEELVLSLPSLELNGYVYITSWEFCLRRNCLIILDFLKENQ